MRFHLPPVVCSGGPSKCRPRGCKECINLIPASESKLLDLESKVAPPPRLAEIASPECVSGRGNVECLEVLQVKRYLDELSRRIELATDGMSADAMLRAPEGKWCTAQILEHLRLTYILTAKALDPGRSPAGFPRSTLKQTISQLLVVRLAYFPKGRKAPEFAVPKTPLDREILPHYREALKAMDAALSEAEQRVGRRKYVATHFALGSMTADQWRKFHFVHGSHHAAQIEALRQWLRTVPPVKVSRSA